MAQLVKCLHQMHGDLNSDPQYPQSSNPRAEEAVEAS